MQFKRFLLAVLFIITTIVVIVLVNLDWNEAIPNNHSSWVVDEILVDGEIVTDEYCMLSFQPSPLGTTLIYPRHREKERPNSFWETRWVYVKNKRFDKQIEVANAYPEYWNGVYRFKRQYMNEEVTFESDRVKLTCHRREFVGGVMRYHPWNDCD